MTSEHHITCFVRHLFNKYYVSNCCIPSTGVPTGTIPIVLLAMPSPRSGTWQVLHSRSLDGWMGGWADEGWTDGWWVSGRVEGGMHDGQVTGKWNRPHRGV